MLMNVSHLLELPVLSLHAGGPVAWLESEIVDPATLMILGFYINGEALDDPEVGEILDVRSIREISNLGIVVDSAEDFVNVTDVVRIERASEKEFMPAGKKVFDERGKRLGKISDYIIETGDFTIVDIIVQKPFMQAFSYPEIFIPASEIVEVADDRVIVKASSNKIETTEDREKRIPFTNPFRKPLASTTHTKIPEQLDNESA